MASEAKAYAGCCSDRVQRLVEIHPLKRQCSLTDDLFDLSENNVVGNGLSLLVLLDDLRLLIDFLKMVQ